MAKDFLRKIEMLFTVCFTGMCVLIIEVLATRMLSPYFGNTIFSVSSVITVVLLALSFGYSLGGRMADKNPSKKLFYGIIFWSGVTTLLISTIYIYILPEVGFRLPLNSGPLIISMVLFFLPSFLLGMLSPFAIKLEDIQNPGKGIGSVSGRIFFWSTFGSILGSLLTGFVLVPNLGVSTIIVCVGLLLILFSSLALIILSKKNSFYIIFAIIISLLVFFCSKNTFSNENLVFTHDGIYEKISITKRIYDNKPILLFTQDRSASSAMYIDDPYKLVFPYTTYYELYKLFNPKVGNTFIIGGGAYSIPKALLKEGDENSKIYVSEIETSLVDIAKKFFALPDDNRLLPVTEDGRQFLERNDTKFNMIFSDVYFSYFSIPTHFTTKEFFQLAKSRLEDNGIFIGNLAGTLSKDKNSFIFSEIKTFKDVFPNSYFFAVDNPGFYGPQNIMILGVKGDKKLDIDSAKNYSYNNLDPKVFDKIIDLNRYNMDQYITLTDDYSPVESMLKNSIAYKDSPNTVNSKEILSTIKTITSFGPRTLGSEGSKRTVSLISSELKAQGISANVENFNYKSWDGKIYNLSNVIGQIRPEQKKRIILGTHYDTKNIALDKENSENPYVPGANNGASGVAVLLELARVLNQINISKDIGIDLVFFDGEEGDPSIVSDFTGWEPIGSKYFSEHLVDLYGSNMPEEGIILDMVCDRDLHLKKDLGSIRDSKENVNEFWDVGLKLFPKQFSSDSINEIRDDNTPLNKVGIPSFLVIDYNYPYIYTTADKDDKCSEKSLNVVATTLVNYLDQK